MLPLLTLIIVAYSHNAVAENAESKKLTQGIPGADHSKAGEFYKGTKTLTVKFIYTAKAKGMLTEGPDARASKMIDWMNDAYSRHEDNIFNFELGEVTQGNVSGSTPCDSLASCQTACGTLTKSEMCHCFFKAGTVSGEAGCSNSNMISTEHADTSPEMYVTCHELTHSLGSPHDFSQPGERSIMGAGGFTYFLSPCSLHHVLEKAGQGGLKKEKPQIGSKPGNCCQDNQCDQCPHGSVEENCMCTTGSICRYNSQKSAGEMAMMNFAESNSKAADCSMCKAAGVKAGGNCAFLGPSFPDGYCIKSKQKNCTAAYLSGDDTADPKTAKWCGAENELAYLTI